MLDMAREEQDREDLLREATGLSQRVELDVQDEPEPVVIGFRDSGSISFYFGAEPVFQFTSDDRLRRAYANGLLYKAERGKLVSLRRVRTSEATVLERHELTDEETVSFLDAMKERLTQLQAHLLAERFTVVGQVPEDGAVVPQAVERLPLVLEAAVADTPRAR